MDTETVKAGFRARGETIRAWSKARGFSAGLVYAVLGGRVIGSHGESHRIAVALGLKSDFGQASPDKGDCAENEAN